MQLALLLPSLTAPYVPLLTFGIVSLIGSILAIALPETAGHHLPDSFAEVNFQGYVSKISATSEGNSSYFCRWSLGGKVDPFGAGICLDGLFSNKPY